MTTYNGEKFVKKQLQSILNQTKKPDEVIIVDDCSTDDTVEIVRDFIRSNSLLTWELIILPENKGFINSFNRAILKTSGDIIFLCDQDDVWLSDKVEIMSKIMVENPKIIALASGFHKIDSDDKRINSFTNLFTSNNNLIRKIIKDGECVKIDLRQVIIYNISPGCTSAFKSVIKEVLKELEEPRFNLVHDWKINIIAAGMDGLYFLNTPATNYRLHETNAIGLTRTYSINYRIDLYKKGCIDREFMINLLEKMMALRNINNRNNLTENLNLIIEIRENLFQKIAALNKGSIKDYLLMLSKFDFFKTRMIEGWVIDIIIILKNKFSW